MTEPKREDVVLIASTLYSIVAGLAITTAIGTLLTGPLGSGGNSTAILSPVDLVNNPVRTLQVLSFFLFAIPFYHGATLVLAISMRSTIQERAIRPLIDFFVLFFEAGILFAMSLSVRSQNIFVSWIIALVIVDMAWAIVKRSGGDVSPMLKRTLMVWIILDILVGIFLSTFRLAVPLYVVVDVETGSRIIFAVALLRTASDYWFCRDFYLARVSQAH